MTVIDYEALIDDPSELLETYSLDSFNKTLDVHILAEYVLKGFVRSKIDDGYVFLNTIERQYDREIVDSKPYHNKLLHIVVEHIRLSRLDSLL